MSESQEQLPYFLPSEVVLKNSIPGNCWLSCLGGVYDLSEYVTQNAESLIAKYLIAHGGRDVSHWFDAGATKGSATLRRYVEPGSGRRRILLPFASPKPEVPRGMYYSADNLCPQEEEEAEEPTGKCWSELERMMFGSRSSYHRKGWLTKKPRLCSMTNVLTAQRAIISVCEEDSIGRIQERALIFNRHGASYTCKFEGKLLDAALSLTENGIADSYLGERANTYVPNLLCYYNDDLTEL